MVLSRFFRGAPVKFFTHELSCKGRLRRVLIRNPTSRIYSTVFDLVAKVSICVLYFVRVCLDNPDVYACYGERCSPNGTEDSGSSGFTSTNINWHVILWIHRPMPLWILELIICLLTISKAILYVCIATKGTVCDHIFTQSFLLEIFCSVPLIATAFFPFMLKDMFVPLFLNCWLAQGALRRLMVSYLHEDHQ
ncbi:potassium channel subfamily T member 1-like [Littorina saxatilis]|uniref:potassium channel subfamily T member 1-like n=1 Tax=Littorina saxatilis TaxID=31220 RepID=UPI0038B5EAA0